MTRLTRFAAVVLAAVTVPVLAAPLALAAPTSGSASLGTVVAHVRPVTADGTVRDGYRITAHTSGSCLLGSIAVGAAYRCFGNNNEIYDPCWLQAPSYVVCLSAPWRHHLTRLHVTDGFDNSLGTVAVPSQPWGVQTTSGRHCLVAQGATGAVHGHRISYLCRGHVVLVGRVDRSGAVWRIRRAVDTGGYHYVLRGHASLTHAWFGRPSLVS